MQTQRPIMVGPAMEIHHPIYGDMTEDVARELQALNREAEERAYIEAGARQKLIARTCGRESRVMKGDGGMRLIAQIDEDVYNYWEQREGREFWTEGGELNKMLKKHPELAVTPKIENPSIRVGFGAAPAKRVLSKRGRGRWAT